MNPNRFSSLAAFLEYYTALRRAAQLTDDERAAIATIEPILAILTPDERASLDGAAGGGATARRNERARHKLARELAARGMLES